jgi:hypothetical protein
MQEDEVVWLATWCYSATEVLGRAPSIGGQVLPPHEWLVITTYLPDCEAHKIKVPWPTPCTFCSEYLPNHLACQGINFTKTR